MRSKILAIILFTASLVSILSVSHSVAQNRLNASNITVRPFLQEIKLEPGVSEKQFDLTINNDSKFKQIFSLSEVNFGSLNETGGLVFAGASAKNFSSKYGLTKWLKLEKDNIEIAAGQQAVIKVSIVNDNDMEPGAHYAAIITTAQKPIEAVDQLTITPKVSSLIFATKQGGESYNIHLRSVEHNGSLWKLPTKVNLRIQSTGNTYIVPRGVVSIKQGSKINSRGIINSQSAIVLPESTRNFEVPITQLINPDRGLIYTNYKIQIDYRYDGVSSYASKTYNYKILNKSFAISILYSMAVTIAILVLAWRTGRMSKLNIKLSKHKKN